MENELFDTSIYISTASVDNTTPPNTPAAQKKKDIIAAGTIATNAITPISDNASKLEQTIVNYISDKVTTDDLICTFNDAAAKVMTGIDEAKGKVFLTIITHNRNRPDDVTKMTYGNFISDNPQRRKFIGKSDYYALRTFYQRLYELPDELKQYVDNSKLTNAKCALNMPGYSADKLTYIKDAYPTGIPTKKEFAKLLLPPPTQKIEKPKGKPRNMSIVNMQLVNRKFNTFTARAIKSLRETHKCNDDIIHELQNKYDEFNSEFTAILADLQQSAKRTNNTKKQEGDSAVLVVSEAEKSKV